MNLALAVLVGSMFGSFQALPFDDKFDNKPKQKKEYKLTAKDLIRGDKFVLNQEDDNYYTFLRIVEDEKGNEKIFAKLLNEEPKVLSNISPNTTIQRYVPKIRTVKVKELKRGDVFAVEDSKKHWIFLGTIKDIEGNDLFVVQMSGEGINTSFRQPVIIELNPKNEVQLFTGIKASIKQ